MKQQQNSLPKSDLKTDMKIRSGKDSTSGVADKKDATSGQSQKSADKLVQGQDLEKKDRGGDTTDTDEVKR